jgi:hypothetical protein
LLKLLTTLSVPIYPALIKALEAANRCETEGAAAYPVAASWVPLPLRQLWSIGLQLPSVGLQQHLLRALAGRGKKIDSPAVELTIFEQ